MKAYVVYRDSPSCLRWLLKRGFGHCAVVLDQGDDTVIVVEARHMGVSVDVHKVPRTWTHTDLLKDFLVVDVIDRMPLDRQHTPNVFTCVELTKRILGINKWWILTPYQLHKHIIKENKYVN